MNCFNLEVALLAVGSYGMVIGGLLVLWYMRKTQNQYDAENQKKLDRLSSTDINSEDDFRELRNGRREMTVKDLECGPIQIKNCVLSEPTER